MTRWGRRWRQVAGLSLVVALVVGTWWGDDDHFPFGPFRMYASTVDLDAPTSWLELEVLTADGRRLPVPANLGLRRAELEARAPQFTAEPSTLAPLLDAYARAHPGDGDGIVAIRLLRWDQAMAGGRPDGAATSAVVATWSP